MELTVDDAMTEVKAGEWGIIYTVDANPKIIDIAEGQPRGRAYRDDQT